MLRVLEPKKGKEWGMKRIERIRRRVERRNREEIDGVDEKKGRNGGEDVAAMWCGGGSGGCVGVCVCGLQIQRESLERLTRKTCGTAQTGEFLVTAFAILSAISPTIK